MKVLVIEDDSIFQQTLRRLLQPLKFELHLFDDAEAALEAYKRQFFPLIITDVNLPGMTGLELCQKIRETPEGRFSVIFFVTGEAPTENLQKILDAGADDYIGKPFHKSEFDIRIHILLQQVHNRQHLQATLIELQQLKKAVETMQLGVTITDLQGKIIFTNPAEARMHGYQPDELIGHDVRVFAGEERHFNAVESVHNWTGLVRKSTNIKRDGTMFSVRLISDIIRDKQGRAIAIVTICEDITEQEQTHQRLTTMQARIANILDIAAEAIITIDYQHRITVFNKGAEQIFGYEAHEILDRPLNVLLPQRFQSHHEAHVEQFNQSGRLFYRKSDRREIIGLRKDGSEFPAEASISRLEVDKSIYFTVVLHDITYRKETEKALHQAKHELELRVQERTAELQQANELLRHEIQQRRNAEEAAEAANKAKSEFMTNMSHELRTPLNGIMGFAQILKKDKNLSDRQIEGLNTIYHCSEHLLALINEVLDLSKIEARRLELNPGVFDLPAALRSVAEMMQLRAVEKGLKFYYQPAPNLPGLVYADEKRLRQILINLVGNAIKFTVTGWITLRAFLLQPESPQTECLVRFEVEDTGIGIPLEQSEAIFEAFHQIKQTQIKAEGTGLGLAISQQLAALMQSKLHVHSSFNQGSRFWFDLKLQLEREQGVESARTPQISGYTGPRQRILVADDLEHNRQILVEILTDLGFEVSQAFDGRSCYEMACVLHPVAIILDLRMPIMDGLEVARLIRSAPELANTILIILSASAYADDRTRSLSIGCNDYLTKPIRTSELLAALERHLSPNWTYHTLPELSTQPDDPDTDFVLSMTDMQTLRTLAERGSVRKFVSELDRISAVSGNSKTMVQLRKLATAFDFKSVVHLLDKEIHHVA